MPDEGKGGRPRIGSPLTITLPDGVIREIDAYAAEEEQGRSAVARALVIEGAAARRARRKAAQPAEEDAARPLRPAAALLATWIGQVPGEIRARFLAYRRAANDAPRLVQLLVDAATACRHAVDPGVVQLLMAKDSTGPASGWRGMGLLFFAVVAEMGKQGVAIPAGGPGDDEITDAEEAEQYA